MINPLQIECRIDGLKPLQAMALLAPNLVQEESSRAMTKSTLRVTNAAKRFAPYRTGNLRRSIHPEVRPLGAFGVEGRVGTAVQYAPYPEFGTGIYGPRKQRIYPVTKNVLAWKTRNGKWAVARSIAGMRPKPYMRPGFGEQLPHVENDFRVALQNVCRRMVSAVG